MDKEQKKRMAYRTVVQQDDGQGDIDYTVQVSGDRVELHLDYDPEREYGDGDGPEAQSECWTMSKDILKQLITAASWCIEKSEAFESAHPISKDKEEVI